MAVFDIVKYNMNAILYYFPFLLTEFSFKSGFEVNKREIWLLSILINNHCSSNT